MLATSVLIPSLGRPARLRACLEALAHQTRPPDEVLVVWQGDDVATRDAAEAVRSVLPALRVLHAPRAGIVTAENLALDAARGELILLVDDDAVPPPDWLARHAAHYADPRVGAVGGPARNHRPDGTPQPERAVEPLGRLTWSGRVVGNMYNHPPAWRARAPIEVDHLVGNNLSLRRRAFGRFEEGLRRYWQLFELDACLQVRARGYRVLFDYGLVVEHYPSEHVYGGERSGDLEAKVRNGAFNLAYVLARHSPQRLRWLRLARLLLVGSVSTPGVLAALEGVRRHGRPAREARLLGEGLRGTISGWRAGARPRGDEGGA